MDTARRNYLKNSLKEEVPSIVEVNCDGIEYELGFVPDKIESLNIADAKLIASRFENAQVEDSRLQNLDEFDNDYLDADIVAHDDSVYEKNANEYDQEVEAATEIGKSKFIAKGKTTTNKRFDHLISKYMNMICEVCKHRFKTLTEAISHYRYEHNQQAVTVKCCQRQLSLRDIRYHIQFHLNPDVFK